MRRKKRRKPLVKPVVQKIRNPKWSTEKKIVLTALWVVIGVYGVLGILGKLIHYFVKHVIGK